MNFLFLFFCLLQHSSKYQGCRLPISRLVCKYILLKLMTFTRPSCTLWCMINRMFLIYQFANWSGLVCWSMGGRCFLVREERDAFFHQLIPHFHQNHTAERRGGKRSMLMLWCYACLLSEYTAIIWCTHMCVLVFVSSLACFFSSFCISCRGVILCAPLKSLSSKVAWASVMTDFCGKRVRPDSRLTAFYTQGQTANAETVITLIHCTFSVAMLIIISQIQAQSMTSKITLSNVHTSFVLMKSKKQHDFWSCEPPTQECPRSISSLRTKEWLHLPKSNLI